MSIGYLQHRQKRLLLCNLTELFATFWEKLYNLDFQNFVLFVQFCKMIGSTGSHFVCVCAIHQNTILACYALNPDYKDFINRVVFSNTNKLCMVHHFLNRPGKDNL